MGLLRFILGVLGIILIVGAFSSFIPLLFLGGIASGSVAFAFGFPIFLMVLGTAMVYFGFYYKESTGSSNPKLIWLAKWGSIHTIGILIADYIISRLMITDTLLIILLSAILVSILTQVVRNHEFDFKWKWFIFYFLVYANIIWLMEELILPEFYLQLSFFTSILIGFTLAGAIDIIQKFNLKGHSVNLISFVLVVILLVSNLESLQSLPRTLPLTNSSNILESKQTCPTPMLSTELTSSPP